MKWDTNAPTKDDAVQQDKLKREYFTRGAPKLPKINNREYIYGSPVDFTDLTWEEFDDLPDDERCEMIKSEIWSIDQRQKFEYGETPISKFPMITWPMWFKISDEDRAFFEFKLD